MTEYEIIMKELKTMREDYRKLAKQVEDFLLEKHEDNSEAIDNIVIEMLGGDTSEE